MKKTATQWATEHARHDYGVNVLDLVTAAIRSHNSGCDPLPSERLLAREGYSWYLKNGEGTIHEDRWFREYNSAYIDALLLMVEEG